jgi:hypothetical protein
VKVPSEALEEIDACSGAIHFDIIEKKNVGVSRMECGEHTTMGVFFRVR